MAVLPLVTSDGLRPPVTMQYGGSTAAPFYPYIRRTASAGYDTIWRFYRLLHLFPFMTDVAAVRYDTMQQMPL